MPIKGFSIFISCGHFDEEMGVILAISVVGHPRTFLSNYFEIKLLAYEEMSIKHFFYFKLWWPFCSKEQNHFMLR